MLISTLSDFRFSLKIRYHIGVLECSIVQSPKKQKTKEKIVEELASALQEAEDDKNKATGKCVPPARKGYQEALKRFNDFVIDGKMPDNENE
jgi:hypothetical protein